MKKSIAAVLSFISVAAFLFVIAGCGKENKHPVAKRIAAEEFGMEEIWVTCSGGRAPSYLPIQSVTGSMCWGSKMGKR